MKFKLDENLGASIQRLLTEKGLDTDSVYEENLCGVSDDEIYNTVLREKRCLITLDQDFCELRRFPPEKSYGIIVIKVSFPMNIKNIYSTINSLADVLKKSNPVGKLWIVSNNKIRIYPRMSDS